MTPNIRVAFAGAGNMAQEHAKVFQSIEDVELVGVTSKTGKRAKDFADRFGIKDVCLSIDELYTLTKPDLLVITVPELATKSVVSTALRHPWKLLIEKPVGYNFVEARQISEIAKEKKDDIFVGFNRRYYSSALQILEGVSNFPTEKRYIYVQDQQNIQEAINLGQPEIVADNYMYANSVHIIDLINFFGRGEVVEINNILPWKGRQTDRVLSVIKFAAGDVAVYDGVWKGPGPWSCSVSINSARWSMQPLEEANVQLDGERKRRQLLINDDDRKFKPGLFRQNSAVIHQMKGGVTNVVTLAQSYETMSLISKIYN